MVQHASGRRTPATSSGTRGSAALSTPANLQLSGAWGFYESRHQEDNLSIRALEQETRDLSASSKDLKKQLEEALAQLSASRTQVEVAETERKQLTGQLSNLRVEHRRVKDKTTAEIGQLASEAAQLRSKNQALQDAAMLAQGRASQAESDLAAASEDLAASHRSEQILVERVEHAEARAAELAGRNAALERENVTLLQQRDHHINHSELLMKEKNRYFAMLMDLRDRHGKEGGGASKETPRAAASGPGSSSNSVQASPCPSSPSLMGSVKAAAGSFTPRVAVREAIRLRGSSAAAPGSAPPRSSKARVGTPVKGSARRIKTPSSASRVARRPRSPYGGVSQ